LTVLDINHEALTAAWQHQIRVKFSAPQFLSVLSGAVGRMPETDIKRSKNAGANETIVSEASIVHIRERRFPFRFPVLKPFSISIFGFRK